MSSPIADPDPFAQLRPFDNQPMTCFVDELVTDPLGELPPVLIDRMPASGVLALPPLPDPDDERESP